MKKLITTGIMGLALALNACGGDACDDAADKFEECFGEAEGNGEGGEEVECSGAIECQANCASDASCENITAAFTGTDNSYSQCVAACGG
jgi:hypothetical protein